MFAPSVKRHLLAVLAIAVGLLMIWIAQAEVSAQGPTATPSPAVSPTVSLAVSPAVSPAASGTASPAVSPAVSLTPGPGKECGECHLNIVASWQDSLHAKAYHDPAFQTAWEKKGQDKQCLACHTTGYVAQTGEFTEKGVTCTACHGKATQNHPPEPVAINAGVEACTNCHTTTLAEWKKSAHGTQQLACTTCHTTHPQKLRFETANALCLNCHKETLTDYPHISHPKQTCVECHWYRNPDETKHILTGNLLPTGHDSVVETRTCTGCHADLKKAGTVVAVAPTQPSTLETQTQKEELETSLKTVQAQAENAMLLRTAEGVALGAVLGGVLMVGVFIVGNRKGRTASGK